MTGNEKSRPDPNRAGDLAEFVQLLGRLVLEAGAPSHREIAKRVGPLMRPPQVLSKSTISDVFQPGRRRLNLDLVVAIVRAMGLDDVEVDRWRQACIRVHAEAKIGGPVGVFRQLPADLATFTGREAAIKELLDAASAPNDDRPRAVVLSAIEGMAGVGKTQLALHTAHELVRTGRFADVQLYVNLRGVDPEHPSADPADVLDAFLRALEVPAQHIPVGSEARAAMFRDRMHGKRALVLLDNAADGDQVRDLIPASPTCLVLVTSRRSLAALDNAAHLQLQDFTHSEALELLAKIAGEAVVAAEPAAASEVVDMCGRLPLAVALAGARLRSRRQWSLSDLAAYLRGAGLHGISAGGRRLHPFFAASSGSLPADQQRMFRLLGQHPGADFGVQAAAALADVSETEAEDLLEELLDVHLLRQDAYGRYGFHSLMAQHARAVGAASNSGTESLDAQIRLLDYFRDGSGPGWQAAERGNFVAVTERAEALGRDGHVWQIAANAAPSLQYNGHGRELVTVAEAGIRAARRLGEPVAILESLRVLAGAYLESGELAKSSAAAQEQLNLARHTATGEHEAAALSRLGALNSLFGDYATALDFHRDAVEAAVRSGTPEIAGVSWANLSHDLGTLGLLEDALAAGLRSEATLLELGDHSGALLSRAQTGLVLARLGRHREASELSESAVLEAADEFGEAYARIDAADSLLLADRPEEAREHADLACVILDHLDQPLLLTMAANSLATANGLLGRESEAMSQHRLAWDTARRVGYRGQEARALAGMRRARMAASRGRRRAGA